MGNIACVYTHIYVYIYIYMVYMGLRKSYVELRIQRYKHFKS